MAPVNHSPARNKKTTTALVNTNLDGGGVEMVEDDHVWFWQ